MPTSPGSSGGRREPSRRQRTAGSKQSNEEESARHHEEGGEREEAERCPPVVHNPPAVHRAIIARHLGGGAPATGDAYARAVDQWFRLPGAIRRPATDIREGGSAADANLPPAESGPSPEPRGDPQ